MSGNLLMTNASEISNFLQTLSCEPILKEVFFVEISFLAPSAVTNKTYNRSQSNLKYYKEIMILNFLRSHCRSSWQQFYFHFSNILESVIWAYVLEISSSRTVRKLNYALSPYPQQFFYHHKYTCKQVHNAAIYHKPVFSCHHNLRPNGLVANIANISLAYIQCETDPTYSFL